MFAAAHSHGSRATQRLHDSVESLTSNRRMNRFRLMSAIEAASDRQKARERLQQQLYKMGSRAHLLQHQQHQQQHSPASPLSPAGSSSPVGGGSDLQQFASLRSEGRRSSTEAYATRSLFGRLGSLADQAHLTRKEKIWSFFSDPTSSRVAWIFGILVFILIITSCVSFIVESIPQFCCGRYDSILEPIEAVCIAFFTVEYLGRFYAVPHYWPQDRVAAMAELQQRRAEEERQTQQEESEESDKHDTREEESKGPGHRAESGGGGGEKGGEGGGGDVSGTGGAAVVSAFTALGWRRNQRKNQIHPAEGGAGAGAGAGRGRVVEGMGVHTPWRVRVRFASGVMNVVDLVAIVPFYVELVLAATMGSDAANLSWLRVLRLVRVFRVLKISKYSEGLGLLANTMERSARTLVMLLLFEGIAVVLISSALFFAERGVWCDADNDFCAHTGEDLGPGWYAADGAYAGSTYTEGCRSATWCRQRSKFDNIMVAGYWCIQTMTTTGYGDLVPQTVVGRLVGCLTMLLGLVLIALPITVISENFAQEYQQQQLEQLQAAEEQWYAQHGWLDDDYDLARSLASGAFSSDALSSGRGAFGSGNLEGPRRPREWAGGGDGAGGAGETRERAMAGETSAPRGEAVSGAAFGSGDITEGGEGRGAAAGGEGERAAAAGGEQSGDELGGEGRGRMVSFDACASGGEGGDERWRRTATAGSDGDSRTSSGGGHQRRWPRRVSLGSDGEREEFARQRDTSRLASDVAVDSLASAHGPGSSGAHWHGCAEEGGASETSLLVSTKQQLAAPPQNWDEEEESYREPRGTATGRRGPLRRKDSRKALAAFERQLAAKLTNHRQQLLAQIEERLAGCAQLIVDEVERELREAESGAAGSSGEDPR